MTSHGTTATWSGTNILVPQPLAVLPWLTSISWQLSRILSMCFLCFIVVYALILLAFRACFAFVSQVVALAVPTLVMTRAPSVCAIQVKHQRDPLPPSAMSSHQLASTRNPLRAWTRYPNLSLSVSGSSTRVNPRATVKGCELFRNKQQTLIYLDVIKNKQNTYVDVKWIEMHHLRKDKFRAYYGEARDLVEQFGIEHVISFQLDYDPELICQFFASVYFHPGEERRMT